MEKLQIYSLVDDAVNEARLANSRLRHLALGTALIAIYDGKYHIDYEIENQSHLLWALHDATRNFDDKAFAHSDAKVTRVEATWRHGLFLLIASLYENGYLPKAPRRLTAYPPQPAKE